MLEFVGRVGGRDVAPLSGWGLGGRTGQAFFFWEVHGLCIYMPGLCDVVLRREDVYRARGCCRDFYIGLFGSCGWD